MDLENIKNLPKEMQEIIHSIKKEHDELIKKHLVVLGELKIKCDHYGCGKYTVLKTWLTDNAFVPACPKCHNGNTDCNGMITTLLRVLYKITCIPKKDLYPRYYPYPTGRHEEPAWSDAD